jgi:spore maturation protein CgeB
VAFLERLTALPGRPPLVGWVGDAFDEGARGAAAFYDLLAYTDTGLVARHAELGFPSARLFLPHAANLARAPRVSAQPAGPRVERMVFFATPTSGWRVVVEAVKTPLAIHGPAWAKGTPSRHDVHDRRVAASAVPALYARHLAALNVRNERNVLHGLNQRAFDPYLSATPVVSDDQPDLALCFEPQKEVLVWRDLDELNAHYDRLVENPDEAARIGGEGRRRLFAQHGFGHRLKTLRQAL